MDWIESYFLGLEMLEAAKETAAIAEASSGLALIPSRNYGMLEAGSNTTTRIWYVQFKKGGGCTYYTDFPMTINELREHLPKSFLVGVIRFRMNDSLEWFDVDDA